MRLARRGLCLVIAAPSGAGKSSIVRALLKLEPELKLSISVTTRAPRAGERDGVEYFFRNHTAFQALAASGELLEWAAVFGHCYGTPRAPVEAALAAGCDMAFDIDWQGYRSLRGALPGDMVGVFILPPSLDSLEARLIARGDEPAAIARRMDEARAEIAHWAEFDHVVVNDDLENAVQSVRAILCAARLASARQTGATEFIARLIA